MTKDNITLFFDHCGPVIKYGWGRFYVADLNPEASITWRMSRWELFKLGLKCLMGAFR